MMNCNLHISDQLKRTLDELFSSFPKLVYEKQRSKLPNCLRKTIMKQTTEQPASWLGKKKNKKTAEPASKKGKTYAREESPNH